MTEEALFAQAIELAPVERSAFLGKVCGDDAELRKRVEIRLRSHDDAEGSHAEPVEEEEAGAPGLGEGVSVAGTGADPDAPVPFVFGQRIAQGGMGAILEAEDCKLGRKIAVKVMRLKAGAGEEQRQRFIQEAAVLGRLEHPNIVPIHDLGRDTEGSLYYTMKLVQGHTLQDVLNDLRGEDPDALREYPLERLLTVFRKVCDAIAFAHSRGILHRDLKPENIMVGEFGEVLVMDWGLSKVLDAGAGSPSPDGRERLGALSSIEALSATLEGSVLGTPRYMSPEQASGLIDELDERSDIFSLGGILYAILTLRPPVEGKSLEDVLDKVTAGDIASPAELTNSFGADPSAKRNDDIPRAEAFKPLLHLPWGRVPAPLSAVTMKALELDKAARYQDVDSFSADIEKFQGGFATTAEETGPWKELLLWMKRNRTFTKTVGVASATLLIVVGIFVVNLSKAKRMADEEAENATEARIAMEGERNAARVAEATAQIGLAEAALAGSNLRLVGSTLASVPEEFRGDDWRYLKDQIRSESLPLTGRLANIVAACPHPRRPSIFAVWDAEGALSLVDVATGERVFDFPHLLFPPGVENSWPEKKALAFSADGKRLAAAHAGNIRFLDGETGEIQGEWRGQPDHAFTWSDDGKLLSTKQGVLDITTGRELWISATEEDLKGPLAWGFEGRHAFFLPGPKELLNLSNSWFSVRDQQTGEVLRKLQRFNVSISQVEISPDRDEFIFGKYSKQSIEQMDVKSGAVREIATGLKLQGYAFSHDGACILIAGLPNEHSNYIKTVHRRTGQTLETRLVDEAGPLRVHPLSGEVLILGDSAWALPPQNRKPWLVFSGAAGDVLWEFAFIGSDEWFLGSLTRSDQLQEFKPFEQEVKNQRFFWNLDVTNDSIRARPSPPDNFKGNYHRAFYPSRDGLRFAGLSWSDHLEIFEREEGSETFVSRFHGKLLEKPVPRRLSLDSEVKRFWSNDGIWDAESCELILRLELSEGDHVEYAVWLPDGSELIGLARKTNPREGLSSIWHAIRWDAGTGTILKSVELPCAMNMLKLSPDAKQLALTGADKAMHFLDSTSLEPLGRLRAHNEEVLLVDWHPTRPILVTTSTDLATKLWDLEDYRLLETIWAPRDRAMGLKFSPSGQLLVCHSNGGGVFVYDVRDYLEADSLQVRDSLRQGQDAQFPDPEFEPPALHSSLAYHEPIEARADEWIPTRDSDAPLRKHGQFMEISRDAAFKMARPGEQPVWNRRADLLMAGLATPDDFTFHTSQGDRSQPHVVIRLNAPSKVRAVRVVNRQTQEHWKRAKDLTLWVSDDEENWDQVWQAEDARGEWVVEFDQALTARYLKLGLPGPGVLHLREVVVFGE